MPRIRLMLLTAVLLVIAACTNPQPQPHISTSASVMLNGLQRFSLLPTEADAEAPAAQQAQLHGLLLQGLEQRGYQAAEPAEIQVQYWFSEQTTPLQLNVDTPAPEPLGPYQAVHRLQDVNASLRVQLHDAQQNLLWEGSIDTPLSPASQRTDLLKQAIQRLLRELPRAAS